MPLKPLLSCGTLENMAYAAIRLIQLSMSSPEISKQPASLSHAGCQENGGICCTFIPPKFALWSGRFLPISSIRTVTGTFDRKSYLFFWERCIKMQGSQSSIQMPILFDGLNPSAEAMLPWSLERLDRRCLKMWPILSPST